MKVLDVFKKKMKPVTGKKGTNKVSMVMKEYGKGKLRSGSKKGPVVSNQKQAIAIALNQARKKK